MLTAEGELDLGQPVERLVVEGAWLVDPFSDREGAADVEIRAGRISALTWHEDQAASDGALLVVPALIDLSSTPDKQPAAAAHGGFANVVGAAEQQLLGIASAHPPLAAAASAGVPATILGLPAVGPEVEVENAAQLIEELRQRAHESGPADAAPLHLAHVSTAATLDLVRAARADRLPISCDVTISQICLHDGWLAGDRRFSWTAVEAPWSGQSTDAPPYHPATRLEPPLRAPDEARALAAALADGTVSVLTSGHRPRAGHELEWPYAELEPGISALETCLPLALAAVDAGLLPLSVVVRSLTTAPAAIAHLALPPLAVGTVAQLVIVDLRAEWRVDEESLQSAAHNTPLLGHHLRGRVLATIVDGRLSWQDRAFAQSGAETREGSSALR